MVVDFGLESEVRVVDPGEGQPMQLILVVGRFSDPAVGVDCPNDAMFLAFNVPRALVLVDVYIQPLDVRRRVAGLRSG